MLRDCKPLMTVFASCSFLFLIISFISLTLLSFRSMQAFRSFKPVLPYTVQAQFAREKFILKKSLLILFYHFCISLEILILFLLYFLYPLLLFFLYR